MVDLAHNVGMEFAGKHRYDDKGFYYVRHSIEASSSIGGCALLARPTLSDTGPLRLLKRSDENDGSLR